MAEQTEARSNGDQLARRQTQAAKVQAVFREVNERIVRISPGRSSPIEIVCECLNTRCSESVSLTAEEYEAVRREPGCFVVVAGHDVREVEQVVDAAGRYLVVRKIGVGSAVAAELNPRRRSRHTP